MNDPIISIATIQRLARAAFDRGEPLSACVMHTWTDAYATWAAEYALAHEEKRNPPRTPLPTGQAPRPCTAPPAPQQNVPNGPQENEKKLCRFAADCPTRMRAGDKANGCSTADQVTCSVAAKRQRSPIGAGEEIRRVAAPYALTVPTYGSGPFAALGYQP